MASRVRRRMWRTVCGLLGGLTVRGGLDTGPGPGRVVVANHGSHADTAALLAALPAAGPPGVRRRRRLLVRRPGPARGGHRPGQDPAARRGERGAYPALLAAAGPALAAGRTVVIYPEGTRSTDGRVGEFHSGAVRLARDCGVPIVPVAVLGTRDVLPKHGRLRCAPMEVRIGTPRPAGSTAAAELRAEVVALLDHGPARPGSRRCGPGWRGWSAARAGCCWRSAGASPRRSAGR